MRCRILSLIFIILGIIAKADAFGAVKASGTCGADARWTLTDDGILTISGTGEINIGEEYDDDGWPIKVLEPWYTFYQDISSVVIEEGITTIPVGCFQNYYALKTINLPSTIEYISERAFMNCTSLKKVAVSGGLGSVGNDAFYGCSSIEEVSTNDLKKWCESSFRVFQYDEVPVLDKNGKQVWIWENGSREELYSCTYRIASNPLFYSKSLTVNGNKLSEIEIPDGVEKIGSGAFAGCEYVRRVVFPSSVKTVGEGAFAGCVRLAECETKDINAWSSINFDMITCPRYYASYSNYDEEEDIYNSFNYRPEYFYNSNPLTICNNLIYNGKIVKTVTISEGVKKLGCNAFNGYTSLESIDIPASVTDFPPSTFMGCTGLKDVIVRWLTPYSFTWERGYQYQYEAPKPFSGVSLNGVTLHVPQGTIYQYLASDVWKDFGNIVQYGETNTISGECGDYLTWTLDESGLLNITGVGAMSIYSMADKAPWYSEKSRVKRVHIAEGVTSIGDFAFLDCSALTEITIPSSVTSLGVAAFSGCSGLTSLVVDAANAKYCSEDNVIFTKDKSTLILYAGGKKGSYIIPSSVSKIGADAFSYCSGLTEVTIPSSVTRIDDLAFYYCSGLTKITIPASVTSIGDWAFYGCSGLTEINIPSSVTSIGSDVFRGCSGLTKVTIPSSINRVGVSAFADCSGLTEVNIPSSITSIENSAFYGCSTLPKVTIPSSVTNIATWAFNSCSNLSDVVILRDTPCTIYSNTFSTYGTLHVKKGCASAYAAANYWKNFTIVEDVYIAINTSLSINKGNTATLIAVVKPNILDQTVSWTSSNKEIATVDANGVVTALAFGNATITATAADGELIATCAVEVINGILSQGSCGVNVNYVLYADGLLDITGSGAMTNYSSLTSVPWYSNRSKVKRVKIAEGVTNIGSYAFYPCNGLTEVVIPSSVTSIGTYAFCGCGGLTGVTIPSSVTSIGNDAFSGCSGLTEITIPSSVTSIEAYTFANCSGLTEVTIPSSVTSIGNNAFSDCSGLTSITVPSSVTSIGHYAFNNCSKLTNIVIFKESPTTIFSDTFSTYGTLHVKKGSQSAFAATNYWKNFTIVGDVEIALNNTSLSIEKGNTTTLTATVKPSILDQTVSWTSSNNEIATVEANGVVTAVASGNAIITATAADGELIATCAVEVTKGILSRGTCGDNLTWTLNEEGLLKIEGTGPMYDYSKETDRTNVPWYDNKDLIVTVEISKDATCIGSYAFYQCKNLTDITIPNSVTNIGDYSFAGSGLSSIELPNSVNSIGEHAFHACRELTSIDIPNSVTRIRDYTFYVCQKLTTVTGGKGVTSIGEKAFSMDHALTSVENLPVCTTIGEYAFGDCALTNIDFLPSCTSIGEGAFCGCLALANVGDLPLCTSIGDNAFSDCQVLSSVGNLPACTSIGSSAFWNCTALRSIGDLSSCTSIGDFAFAECGLKTIDLSYCNNIGKEAFAYCKSLESLTLGNNIKQIGDMAFKKCSSLSTITSYIESPKDCSLGANVFEEVPVTTCVLSVPNSTKSLYQSTDQWKDFTNIVEMSPFPCYINGLAYDYTDGSQTAVRVKAIDKKMTDIVIPSEVYELPVVEIEGEAFANCVNLINIVVPSSIRTVGDNIFSGCSSLASIVWNPNMKLPTSALNSVVNPNLLLYVAVKTHAPSSVKNVVVNGAADEITLVDAAGNNNFYVPQAFTAKRISYSHNYTQQTIIGECAGWETIALPFDVQSITHSRNGIIAPFAANNAAAKPFWLYSLGAVGFTASASIKANTPYIISMPNNNAYSDEYIQSGVVTFSAENVSVPKTEAKSSVKGNVTFVPTTLALTQNGNAYTINKNETHDGQFAGSVFDSDLRDVSPFEAYLTLSGSMAKACVGLMDLGFEGDATGITIPTKNSGTRIWCSDGALHISSDKAKTVRIYSVSGTMVRIVNLIEGENTISLPAGAYIVENTKIFVH